MKEETYLSNVISAADGKAQYDAGARAILADKRVLAWIMKCTTEEFAEYSIEQIMECIEGEPEIATVPVLPGRMSAEKAAGESPAEAATRESAAEAITGMSNEDVVPNEGEVRFDIRFYAVTPTSERVKLIVDVEAQKDYYPGYSIVTRGVFYCARLLSAQYGREFTANDYDNVKKVYSIWICMNVPKYDLLSVIVIGLGECVGEADGRETTGNETDTQKLLGMLSVLFSQTMSPEEKERRLRDEYAFEAGMRVKGEWNTMCNLSDLIEERGIARGIEQGIEQGIESGQLMMLHKLVDSGKLSMDDAAATMSMTIEELEEAFDKIDA